MLPLIDGKSTTMCKSYKKDSAALASCAYVPLGVLHGGVGIRSHNCSDPIEKIFYSAYKDDLICIHCGSSNDLTVPVESDTFIHTVQTVRCLNAFTNASLCNVQL